MPEILNLDYHTRRLILKALNLTAKKADARRATVVRADVLQPGGAIRDQERQGWEVL